MKILKISLIVIFSTILWGFVSLSRDYFSTFEIPLKIRNIPTGYAVGFISDEKVSITVKGQGWMLAPFSFGQKNEYSIFVDNKKGILKINVRKFLEKNIWIPSNVQVVQINPEVIDIQIEKIITKEVKIIPNIEFSFDNGYGLTSQVKIKPEMVKLTGPRSFLKKIDTISTKYYKFDNLDDSYYGSIELKKIPKILLEHKFVNIKFDIQKIVENTYSSIPVIVKNVPPKQELVLSPNTVEIVLRGGIKLLSELDPKNITIQVDFSQAINDTLGKIKPQIIVPKNFELLGSNPEYLNYTIKQY